MHPVHRKMALAVALAALLTIGIGQSSAQFLVAPPAASCSCQPVVAAYPPPAVSYYQPAPVAAVSYYAPAYAPAPVVSYYPAAPAVSYYAPAPVYAAPGAVTTTYRYGLFGRRAVSYTNYYSPVVYPY